MVQLVEVTFQREGTSLQPIGEPEIIGVLDEDVSWKPYCEAILKIMIEDGLIPNPA
jgi:hypothetical protein